MTGFRCAGDHQVQADGFTGCLLSGRAYRSLRPFAVVRVLIINVSNKARKVLWL